MKTAIVQDRGKTKTIDTHTLEDAVRDLIKAFEAGKFENSLENVRYYNIKTMKAESPCNVS